MVVAELHRVISEKESTIEPLKDELEKFMDAHMSSSSSLRKAEGIVALFNDLTAKIDALQNEKDTLQEQIGEKNLQVAELEATILGCYIELSFAKENAQKLL
jgi:chromosome segregation ATPase